MKWRNDFVKIFTAFGLAVAVMTTVLTTIRQPMEMYAAEENDTALQELQELAEEKYTAEKKTGFHLSLRDHVFDGNTGLDYSGDVPGEREYMEVFQNLLRSENDQTIVFRFRTTVENCLLFGTGSMPEGDNGTNMGFALQNGKLRVMFRNEKTTGGLRGNLGDILADGEWHTVAVSFLPSRGIGQENLYVVVDGEANIYPVSWYAAWAGGFNQQTSVPYTTFEIGKGKFSANSQLATAAFSGEMDFITVVDEAYDVKRLQEITSGDKSLKNFARSMMAAGSNKIWLFTGGTETVADFLDTEAARNYVGLFEEGIRASGSYIERSKFVFNTAKKGAGIAELIEEYDSRIKGYGASAVGIMVGEADYKKGEKGLEEFKENLKVLTEKIIGDGMVPFLMTPYASAEREKQKNVEKYSDAIVETVGETLKVIDLSSIDTANVRADGSLTQAGHQIVGNQIKTDLGIGFTTNFSFSLQGGTYTVAKQADDGSEAVLQDVTASEDSISVTVADKDGLKLGCDLTDPEGQVISVRVEDAQNTFTVDGLKPNTNYVLSVYNLGRESDESVKETYRPVEIRTAKGGQEKILDYPEPQTVSEAFAGLLEREEPVTYLFMGDSITHGVMTDGYDNVPQIFAKYLNEAGRNDIVLNTGVANATLSTTLDQVEHRLTNYDPDVVFVMLGTNDASTRGEILPGDPRDGSVESFKLRYLDLIQNIYQHRKDTKVVLRVPCEMIPDDARSNYKAYFDAIDDVAEQARQTCPGMEICVVDHKAAWNKYTENVRNDNLAYGTDYGWLKDNVHPNGRGNMAMFQQLVRELGIYRPTSDIANYQFALDAWEKESEIRVTVVRNETDAAFDMDGLTGYADGLKTVTVALTDDTGRCFSKTEVYEEGGRITLTGLDAGGKYTAEVSGKDAETGKKVMFRTTLVKEDAEGIREERERLKEVLQQADEKKPEEFGTVGWDTFQTAKEEARKASDKTDITARELAAAREALLAAMEKLIPVNQKEGNPLRLDETKRYLIYNVYDQNHNAVEGTERALFDDGGQNVGWLKYDDGFEQSYSEKYIWQVRGVPGKSDQYYLRNLGTGFAVMDLEQQAANKDYRYVVSDKNKNNTGDPYTFVIREVKDGKYYVTLEAVRTGKVVAPENGAGDRTYAIFSEDESDKNNYWCIEEAPEIPEVPGQRGKTILWDSPVGNDYYRIPAITTANNGDLVAVTDYRYDSNSDLGDNWPGHPRGHQIDLITRTSEDNGKTWSDSNNLTAGYSIPDNGVDRAAGFGDAAVVADRESDEILLLCASGTYGFINTDRKIRSSMMTSEDNGATWSAPAEIADKIYGLNEDFKAFFFASGRIMQSRYIKVKDHYRIYSAILAHPGNFNEKSNWVVYSDDFGKTWEILGNEETACVPGGDEAKIEELPDGSVLISSRKDNGRYINVFCYDETDETYTRGSWGNVQTLELGRGQGTNGEIMIVYAKEKDTGEYKYLALQSLPTGEGRTNVSIYYKELNPDQNTAEDFVQGWNEDQRFLVQRADSAYSTMTLQKDGKIAFFWEEGSDFYDMAYNSYSLEDITEGKYGMAFQGIGSVMSPYLVETQDQKAAVAGIFQNEKVNWKFVESEPE